MQTWSGDVQPSPSVRLTEMMQRNPSMCGWLKSLTATFCLKNTCRAASNVATNCKLNHIKMLSCSWTALRQSDSQSVSSGDILGLLSLSLQSLQQHSRGDAHVWGAALQVGRATLLGLELLATDGTVWDTRTRRRRGWGAFFTLIQTPEKKGGWGDHSHSVSTSLVIAVQIFKFILLLQIR